MKIKERALSLLLSLVMVLTFMPALTFADSTWHASAVTEELSLTGGTVSDPGSATLEVDVENGEYTGTFVYEWFLAGEDGPTQLEGSDPSLVVKKEGTYYCEVTDEEEDSGTVYFFVNKEWGLEYDDFALFENGSATLSVKVTGNPYGIEYQWYKYDVQTEEDVLIEGADSNTITVDEEGYYRCKASYADEYMWAEIYVATEEPVPVDYYGVQYGGLWYELHSTNESEGADVWAEDIGPSGEIAIPESITLSNGKTYPVRYVYWLGDNVSAVHIPATVAHIEGIGGYWSTDASGNDVWNVKPGFVIYGTNGTAAQIYANTYGIMFRDLAAEAEAARQGTYDPSLPKVKASKPKAAKKAFTAKWKKLKKKQLKSGVTNIEVWACADGAFANGSTIERVVGKKKASLKLKGMQKGVTYFVKVRAIKYVGGVKYVGPWSAVKKVKVKK